MNGLNVQISGDGGVSLGESAEISQSFNPYNGNIAVVLNLTANPNYDMIFAAPSNVNNYLSIQAISQYYKFLENLDLTGYANYLWDYYHNTVSHKKNCMI